jgi:hypothetical protein
VDPRQAGAARNNCGRIVEIFSEGVHAKSFYNYSTIFPRRLPDEGPQNLSTIFLQFFHNFSLLAVYPSEETKILRQFCGRIVGEFGACQIRGRIFLSAAD